jgi:subtilisin family serine protease
MKFARSTLISTIVVGGLVASAGHAQLADPLIPNELMVRVPNGDALAACLSSLSAQFGGVDIVDSIESRGTHLISYALVRGQTTSQVEAALDALVSDGTLLWGELNYAGQAAEGKTDSLWVSQGDIGPGTYGTQYSVDQLGLGAAHLRSTGYGIVVAVLDTGVEASHPLLSGAPIAAGANFVGAQPATVDAGDRADNDGDGLVDEMVGHGTFVAGLVRLVAPDAAILPVTVLDSEGVGDAFKIGKGMYWAIDHGADVVNMSLGSTYRSAIIEDAASEAETKGIVVVGAAGNWNVEDPREYPACDGSSFGVAAVTRLDIKAPFSNYNDKLDFSAPGHSEFVAGSTTVFDPTKSIVSSVPGGGVGVWRGTSFANAFVSAGVALVRAQHPEWPNGQVDEDQIGATIESVLATTAVPLNGLNPAYEGMLGNGRIDLAAATALGPVQPKPGDLNGDGVVGADDLSIVLGAWGPCAGCNADLTFDGAVGADDLGVLLGNWG